MSRLFVISTLVAIGLVSAVLLSLGCHQSAASIEASGEEGAVAAATGADLVAAADEEHKGGAQMWSENCMRCHNLRLPRERSDREWDLIVHQMRVRAGLTEQEHREILEFLQAGN